MRESIIQTTINKFLTWLAKKSVTALYKRTHFWVFSWGLDENTDLYLMSEESYPDYHRFGMRKAIRFSADGLSVEVRCADGLARRYITAFYSDHPDRNT